MGRGEEGSCQRPSHSLQCFQNHAQPRRCHSASKECEIPSCSRFLRQKYSDFFSLLPILPFPSSPSSFSGKEHFSIRWIWEWRGFQRGILLELLYCCSFHERAGRVLTPRAGVCWRSGGRDLVPETALGPHVATFLPAAGPLCPEMGEGEARAEGLEGSP